MSISHKDVNDVVAMMASLAIVQASPLQLQNEKREQQLKSCQRNSSEADLTGAAAGVSVTKVAQKF